MLAAPIVIFWLVSMAFFKKLGGFCPVKENNQLKIKLRHDLSKHL